MSRKHTPKLNPALRPQAQAKLALPLNALQLLSQCPLSAVGGDRHDWRAFAKALKRARSRKP